MLLTSYFGNLKKVPEDYTKLIITRFPPKWLDVNKYPKMYLCQELSPYPYFLLQYKKDNDWEKYVEKFTKQMNRPKSDCNRYLGLIERYLKRGDKICLVCYEKDYEHCHRYLIAKELMRRGIEWKEV